MTKSNEKTQKTLPLTYDPFFKRIFHPDIHKDRMAFLISSIIGEPVTVVKVLPSEEVFIEGGILLIMDILVELADGSITNIEIQKIAYQFPGERISCYSVDLLLRQYSRLRGEKGKHFTYNNLKKVYTIVIYEESPTCCADKTLKGNYIHRGKTTFDTGLKMELLQEYFIGILCVAKFLCQMITTFDHLVAIPAGIAEVYKELENDIYHPQEVLGMYSEALRILDNNTVQYMIDEMKQTIEEKDMVIEEKDMALEEKDNLLKAMVTEKDAALEEKDAEIQHLKQLLNQQNPENK